jgi:hypothetical protein
LTDGDWPSSATVSDLYGGWAAAHADALAADGTPPSSSFGALAALPLDRRPTGA